jgi:hypothetical protein
VNSTEWRKRVAQIGNDKIFDLNPKQVKDAYKAIDERRYCLQLGIKVAKLKCGLYTEGVITLTDAEFVRAGEIAGLIKRERVIRTAA